MTILVLFGKPNKKSPLNMHVRIYKTEGEQSIYAITLIDALCAIEEDAYRMAEAVFHTRDHLTASSTGRNGGRHKAVALAGSYCKSQHWLVGILGIGCKECGALGTQA